MGRTHFVALAWLALEAGCPGFRGPQTTPEPGCLTVPDGSGRWILTDGGVSPCPPDAPYCGRTALSCVCLWLQSCADGVCYPDGGCGPCRDNRDCQGPGQACLPDGGCGPCTRDGDCTAPAVCRRGACGTACASRPQCLSLEWDALARVPDASTWIGAAFGCRFLAGLGSGPVTENLACGTLQPECQPCDASSCAPGQACLGGDCSCASNADCPGGLLCDGGLCVGMCSHDADCACGLVCQHGLCQPPCGPDAGCSDSALPICDATGHCQPCLIDADCGDAGRYCSTAGCAYQSICASNEPPCGLDLCPDLLASGPASFAPAASCPGDDGGFDAGGGDGG